MLVVSLPILQLLLYYRKNGSKKGRVKVGGTKQIYVHITFLATTLYFQKLLEAKLQRNKWIGNTKVQHNY